MASNCVKIKIVVFLDCLLKSITSCAAIKSRYVKYVSYGEILYEINIMKLGFLCEICAVHRRYLVREDNVCQ